MICANPTCNNDFEFDRKQPKKKYCSDRCRRKVCRRTYRSAHKYKPETRHCANPECGGMFDGKRANTIYCSERCRNRVKNIKEIERRRAAAQHPCKQCGGPAKYRNVFCGACKAQKSKDNLCLACGEPILPQSHYCKKCQPGTPCIGPINTSRIRAARLREQAAIERVVEKAKAAGTVGSIDFWNDRRRTPVIGAKKVG